MSGFDELPLSTSAYLADTQHLSLTEHGAYLLILMTMWRHKGWIPDDDRVLANICRIGAARWKKIAAPVRALLISRDGKLSQKRLLVEFERSQKISTANAHNGKLGAAAKALKTKEAASADASVSLKPRQDPATSPPKTDSLTESSKKESLDSKKEERGSGGKRGSALAANWKPSQDERAYGRDLGLDDRQIDAAAEDMRLWAHANRNRAVAVKADWSATFKNWMRRTVERNGGLNGNRHHHAASRGSDFFAGLEEVAASIRGDRPDPRRRGAEVPLGRVNIDG